MLVFKEPIIYLIVTTKHKSGDACNLDMQKKIKSHKTLSLSEKVKEKIYVLRLLRKIYAKNKSFTCEIVKK